MYFYLEPGTKKCIKEEIHKDVVVTGEYEITESPNHKVFYELFFYQYDMGHIVSVLSSLTRLGLDYHCLENYFLGGFESDWFKRAHFI